MRKHLCNIKCNYVMVFKNGRLVKKKITEAELLRTYGEKV